MTFLGERTSSGRRLLPILLGVALCAPVLAFSSVPDCCNGKMPCCPASAAEARGANSDAATAAMKRPVPPCCQTLSPGDGPIAEGRKGTLRSPTSVALPSPSVLADLALRCAGRIAPKAAALVEDSSCASRSARAPPAR